MWRDNLRLRQSLHLSHFLTSADLGLEEIACSSYHHPSSREARSLLLQFINTPDPHIVTPPIPYDDHVIYAYFYIALLQNVRLRA